MSDLAVRFPDYQAMLRAEIGTSLFRQLPFFRYYRRWKKCLENPDVLGNGIPWINFPAIDFLESHHRPDMRVFEYGGGASTLFWASRVKTVTTVEHNEQWVVNLATKLRQFRIENVEVHHISSEPDPDFGQKRIASLTDYISDDPLHQGKHFERYVNKILEFPDAHFDIVVVDGRSRPSCIAAAKSKVKSGGILLLDNTERHYYLSETWPLLRQQGWARLDFFGPVPYLYHFCKTTVFVHKG